MARRKKSDMEKVTCCECGKSELFRASSPAARQLTACEEAHKQGWSYTIGFFAMLTGDHTPRCPECTKGAAHVDG